MFYSLQSRDISEHFELQQHTDISTVAIFPFSKLVIKKNKLLDSIGMCSAVYKAMELYGRKKGVCNGIWTAELEVTG